MNLRALLLLPLLATACGTPVRDDTDTDAGTTADAGTTPDAGAPAECEAAAITCEDEMIQELNLQKKVAPGLIENTADGDLWHSLIDATAGGAFTPTPDSYVYAKFEAGGLTKVELSDDDAVESLDWDIAFRRYVIRLNSGDSGPSCVRAARVPPSKTWDDVTGVDESLIWRVDDFYGEECNFIDDGQGLDSSPATSLASYYHYDGCLQMTNNVFVVELRSGKHLKLSVERYYNAADQAKCDANGTAGMSSAHFLVRWGFLD